jgi:hypothetical protein
MEKKKKKKQHMLVLITVMITSTFTNEKGIKKSEKIMEYKSSECRMSALKTLFQLTITKVNKQLKAVLLYVLSK